MRPMPPVMTTRSRRVPVVNRRRIRGVGLIEVLVTLIILSTALLTLTALQTRSLQFNHSAYLRSQANILAYDILDRVRINRAKADSYNLDADDDAPSPSSSNLEEQDLGEWRALVEATLPGGTSGISCTGDPVQCRVTIKWEEQNTSGDESEDSTTFTYTTLL